MNKKTIFYINNAQNLPVSTAEFIKKIMEKTDVKIAFILIYRIDQNTEPLSIEKLIQFAYEHRKSNSNGIELLKTESDNIHISQEINEKLSYKELENAITNSMTLLAFEDTIKYAKEALADINQLDDSDTTKLHKHNKIALKYSIALCYQGRFREAYICGTSLLKAIDRTHDQEMLLKTYLILGASEYYNNSYDSAHYFAQLSIKLSENLKSERYTTLSYLLMFYIKTSQSDTNLFITLAAKLKYLSWNNILSFTLTSGGYLHAFLRNDRDMKNTVLRYFYSGLNKAQKNKNIYRISISYHVIAGIYGIIEDFIKSDKFLNISKRIKTDKKFPLSKIYNSIGYNYFIIGDFEKAYMYYRKVIKLLNNSKNFVEVCSSLFNMAKVHFMLAEYKTAIVLLEDMVRIMDLLHIENLSFQSRISIYSLLGISHFHTGNHLIAWNYMQKIKRLNNYQIIHQISPLYWFFVLTLNEDNNLTAEYQNKAIQYGHSESPQFLIYAHYIFGLAYEQTGNREKAVIEWNKGIQLCKEYSILSYFYKMLLHKLDSSNEKPSEPKIKTYNFDVQTVIEFVKEERNLNELHKKINEIDFISKFQNLIILDDTKTHLINESIKLLENSFPYDTVIISFSESKHYSNHQENDISLMSIKDFILLLQSKNRMNIFLNQTECIKIGLNSEYKSLLFLANTATNKTSISLILLSTEDQKQINEDDKRILNIFLTQFSSAIELISTREALIKSAKTDKLTGLNNRMEIEKVMEFEYKRILRYPKEPKSVFSLLFIDLDNFKFFNDSFGHHIGDLILVEYAKLLRESIRDIDNIARLGGDEFILLLPETSKENAVKVASRIFELLKKKNHFIKPISKLLGYTPDIPQKNLISCSIGITDVLPVKDRTVSEFLVTADKALYQAKANGKNGFVIA